LVAAAVLFAGLAIAQISAVEGLVKGPDGAPLSGAVIKIERMDSGGRYPTRTSKTGRYFYNGLPLGTYRVTCNVDGKDVDAVEVQTQLGDPIQVNFDLRALAASKKAQPESSPNRSSVLGSVYVNAQDATDRLQLNSSDSSFLLQEGGQKFNGTFVVKGNLLKLHIVQLGKDVDIAIDGQKLIVNGDEIWVQPSR
jgi:hypothetical protein